MQHNSMPGLAYRLVGHSTLVCMALPEDRLQGGGDEVGLSFEKGCRPNHALNGLCSCVCKVPDSAACRYECSGGWVVSPTNLGASSSVSFQIGIFD